MYIYKFITNEDEPLIFLLFIFSFLFDTYISTTFRGLLQGRNVGVSNGCLLL